jgi:hypothetical protein
MVNRFTEDLFDWIEAVVSQCGHLTYLTLDKYLSDRVRQRYDPVTVSGILKRPMLTTWTSALEEVNHRLGIEATKLLKPGASETQAELRWQARQGNVLQWEKRQR